MIKTIDKNFLILFFVFLGASAFRIFLDSNSYIDNIVAFINVISAFYVLCLIIENSSEYLVKLLNDSNFLGKDTQEQKKKHFKKYANIIRVSVLVFGSIYTFVFAKSFINDIIGFVALFLSIQTKYISESIGKLFFKKK